MKLLLTSAGITNKKIANKLLELLGKPFKEAKMVYIPTAGDVEIGDKWWQVEDLVNCKNLGWEGLDIVNIAALPEKMWRSRIEGADVLFFGGGNTFHLMYWVERSGLAKTLPEMLKTKVYVGISAGSMIAAKSLYLSTSDRLIYGEDRLESKSDAGLGFVDFYIRPHFNSESFPKAREEFIAEAAKKVSELIYALDDNSAVAVRDGKVEVVSEGVWKRFN